LHHVYDVERLRAAYLAIQRDAAAGVDGETWRHYGEALEENLRDLAARLRRGAYRAKLRARARRRGATIFFSDEAGIRSDSVLGRTWAPKGRTPEVPTSGRRQAVNAISAISPRGAFWFKVFSQRRNKERFLAFLKAFRRGRKGPIFLVVDRHPAHRARLVAEYVQSLRGQLEIHFLPGYAPELNPDEFVWNQLKNQGVSKKPLRKDESLRARLQRDLEQIQRSPALVR
jgi:transposase